MDMQTSFHSPSSASASASAPAPSLAASASQEFDRPGTPEILETSESKSRFILTLVLAALGILGTLILARGAWAEDARVLPKGRSRLSWIGATSAPISKAYNPNGEAESLTRPYNLELSSTNLKAFDGELARLVGLLNSTGARYDVNQRNSSFHGLTTDPSKPLLGDAMSRGFLGVGAEAIRIQNQISYQYGLTDQLSVGFLIPIVRNRVRVWNSIAGINTASDIHSILKANFPVEYGEFEKVPGALSFVSGVDAETFQNLLASKGYNRFEGSDEQGLGDISVGARYNYWKQSLRSGDWISSAQWRITAPTGRLKAPSDLTKIDRGQGAWELALSHILNYSPYSRLTLSHSLNYTHRLGAQRWMRVRADAADFIPDASGDQWVNTQLGDKLWNTLGAKFQLTSALSLDTSLEMYWKGEDRYSASGDRDTTYLSENTASYTETLQVGATLSSIQAFLGGNFPLPGDLSVNYFYPTGGKNTVIAPFVSAELALYF